LDAREVRAPAEVSTPGLLVVERGIVAVVCTPCARRSIVVAIAAPGDLLISPAGDQRLLALQDAAVRVLPPQAVRHVLEHPAAAEAIVVGLVRALRERDESLAQFANVAHVERVRRKLLQLARLRGKPVDGGVQVELPLTQAMLAQMVGSARETVSGAVRALEREGFLSRSDGRYRLLVNGPM
jgi:CRP-like cAMP-binding protein